MRRIVVEFAGNLECKWLGFFNRWDRACKALPREIRRVIRRGSALQARGPFRACYRLASQARMATGLRQTSANQARCIGAGGVQQRHGMAADAAIGFDFCMVAALSDDGPRLANFAGHRLVQPGAFDADGGADDARVSSWSQYGSSAARGSAILSETPTFLPAALASRMNSAGSPPESRKKMKLSAPASAKARSN